MVDELIHGRDGKVRLVKIGTTSGTLLRPVQRIYPLEIYDELGTCNGTGFSGGGPRKGSDDLS